MMRTRMPEVPVTDRNEDGSADLCSQCERPDDYPLKQVAHAGETLRLCGQCFDELPVCENCAECGGVPKEWIESDADCGYAGLVKGCSLCGGGGGRGGERRPRMTNQEFDDSLAGTLKEVEEFNQGEAEKAAENAQEALETLGREKRRECPFCRRREPEPGYFCPQCGTQMRELGSLEEKEAQPVDIRPECENCGRSGGEPREIKDEHPDFQEYNLKCCSFCFADLMNEGEGQ